MVGNFLIVAALLNVRSAKMRAATKPLAIPTATALSRSLTAGRPVPKDQLLGGQIRDSIVHVDWDFRQDRSRATACSFVGQAFYYYCRRYTVQHSGHYFYALATFVRRDKDCR